MSSKCCVIIIFFEVDCLEAEDEVSCVEDVTLDLDTVEDKPNSEALV